VKVRGNVQPAEHAPTRRFLAAPGDARVVVQTDAEGWFAGVAFDVAVRSRQVAVEAELDPAHPERCRATVTIPTGSFEPHALRHHRSKKPARLSDAEAREIRDKTERALRQAFGPSIVVNVDGGERRGELLVARAAVGASGRLALELEALEIGDRIRVRGRATASLRALGVTPPKAPLGAMVVADRVEITIEATLAASA
jgi:hypothetical protein